MSKELKRDLLIVGKNPDEILYWLFLELQEYGEGPFTTEELMNQTSDNLVKESLRLNAKIFEEMAHEIAKWEKGRGEAFSMMIFPNKNKIGVFFRSMISLSAHELADSEEWKSKGWGREKTLTDAIMQTSASFSLDPIRMLRAYLSTILTYIKAYPSNREQLCTTFGIESDEIKSKSDYEKIINLQIEYLATKAGFFSLLKKSINPPINFNDYPGVKSAEGVVLIKLREIAERMTGAKDSKILNTKGKEYVWLDTKAALEEMLRGMPEINSR